MAEPSKSPIKKFINKGQGHFNSTDDLEKIDENEYPQFRGLRLVTTRIIAMVKIADNLKCLKAKNGTFLGDDILRDVEVLNYAMEMLRGPNEWMYEREIEMHDEHADRKKRDRLKAVVNDQAEKMFARFIAGMKHQKAFDAESWNYRVTESSMRALHHISEKLLKPVNNEIFDCETVFDRPQIKQLTDDLQKIFDAWKVKKTTEESVRMSANVYDQQASQKFPKLSGLEKAAASDLKKFTDLDEKLQMECEKWRFDK